MKKNNCLFNGIVANNSGSCPLLTCPCRRICEASRKSEKNIVSVSNLKKNTDTIKIS